MNKTINGFTIVELLVAIVIIGILASITIVAFNGIQDRAHDTAVKSDLRSAFTKIQMQASVDNRYPEWSSDLLPAQISASTGSYSTDDGYNFVYCPPYPYGQASHFAMIGESKSGTIYVHGTDGASVYSGTWTMADYADICIDLTDKNNTFSGDYNEPELRVTDSGYSSYRTPNWSTWATGGS